MTLILMHGTLVILFSQIQMLQYSVYVAVNILEEIFSVLIDSVINMKNISKYHSE